MIADTDLLYSECPNRNVRTWSANNNPDLISNQWLLSTAMAMAKMKQNAARRSDRLLFLPCVLAHRMSCLLSEWIIIVNKIPAEWVMYINFIVYFCIDCKLKVIECKKFDATWIRNLCRWLTYKSKYDDAGRLGHSHTKLSVKLSFG